MNSRAWRGMLDADGEEPTLAEDGSNGICSEVPDLGHVALSLDAESWCLEHLLLGDNARGDPGDIGLVRLLSGVSLVASRVRCCSLPLALPWVIVVLRYLGVRRCQTERVFAAGGLRTSRF